MNKNQLVDAVAASVGDRRTATAAVEAVLDTITRTVAAGERVALTGFGVFEKADRAARAARNPATGASVQVPAGSVPRFRAGTGFKDVVAGRRPAPQPVGAPGADGATATPAPRRSATRAGTSRAAAQADDQPAKAAAKPAKAAAKPARGAAKPAKAGTKRSKAAESSKAAEASKPSKAAGRSSKAAGASKPATSSKAGTSSATSDKAAKPGAKAKAKDSKKGGPAGKAKAGKGKASSGRSR